MSKNKKQRDGGIRQFSPGKYIHTVKKSSIIGFMSTFSGTVLDHIFMMARWPGLINSNGGVMATMYLQNKLSLGKCSYIFTHPTDKYFLQQHRIICETLSELKIPYTDTN